MEFTIILVGVILVAVIVFVAIHKYQNFANNKVEELSIKIKKLKELNSKIEFHKINEKVYIYKHYDNKGHFNRIEPAYLFSAELKNNIEKYSQYIQKIQDNRRNEIIYNERVKEILTKVYDIDYAAAEMSEKEFKKIEDKLFNALLSYKYTKCVVEVFMTYSSPKGRVSLSKEARFTFDDMLVSFNSISRSRLDYKTYSNLAKVERGNVSDSLRYDILNRDHFRCSICGASAKEGVRLHVDHIIPIAKGGKSVPENLRTLCERCNIGKSDKIETGFNNIYQEHN